MKKISATLGLLFVLLSGILAQSHNANKRWSQLTVKGGIDQAQKTDFTDYIKKNLSGYHAGASYDYYFGTIGIGIDADYYKNKMNGYDQAALNSHISTLGFVNGTDYTESYSQSDLTRFFFGLGPSFKAQDNSSKFVAELNLRGGFTHTDGSSLKYGTIGQGAFIPTLTRDGDAVTGIAPQNEGVFYHEGYKKEMIATAKGQVKLSYFFTPKIAATVGGYYNHYWGAKALYNHLDWNIPSTPAYNTVKPAFGLSNLSSYGAFAGISFRMSSAKKEVVKKANNSISVLVKDELTGQPLYDAEVLLSNDKGYSASVITDKKGLAVFTKLREGNYSASAMLHEIASTSSGAMISGTDQHKMITLIHNDPRFTLEGTAVNINTNEPEGNVSVTVKDMDKGIAKMTTSKNNTGTFGVQLDANTDYELSGKKASYISNIEKISTKGLSRSQTIYVQLHIGIEKVAVGKSIVLNKIFYDLDKADIREDASTDLDKLAAFLNENQGFKVEIASHTDARGSDQYNLELSQKRAQNVVNFLVKKGINKSQLAAKGYGETKLVNKCANGVECTEAQHQQNRRTEFTLISVN